MRLVPVRYLKEDSYLALDVLDDRGRLMLTANKQITAKSIRKLQLLELEYVYIKDRYCYENDKERERTISNIRPFFMIMQHLRDIFMKILEGEANVVDLVNVREICETIVKYTIHLPPRSKIMYEPTKMFAHSVVEESIYVTIMSVHLGHKMELSQFALIELCQAGIMRNMALLAPEFQSMFKDTNRGDKTHPLLAYRHLREFYSISDDILLGVLQHHERHDGKGFPQNLTGDKIHRYAQILSIIDFFYEIRSDHNPIYDDEDTFEKNFYKSLERFNPEVIDVFLKNVQLLNIDTMVELNNGDVGIVIEVNNNLPFRPVVQIIRCRENVENFVTNLAIDNYFIKRIVYYLD